MSAPLHVSAATELAQRKFRQSLIAAALIAALGVAGSAYGQSARVPAAVPASTVLPKPALEELLLQVSVNGVPQGDARLVLREADGTLLFGAKDLESWRVQVPANPARMVDGMGFHRMSSMPGATVALDEPKLAVALTLPATAFESSELMAGTGSRTAAVKPGFGGFLGYDLVGERSGGVTRGSGFFEAGVFSPWGVGTTSLVARSQTTDLNTVVRLDSTWTYDRPEQMASFRLGDSINRAAAGWGRVVRFGGIQYATNFATQPGLILLPQQSVAGSAVVPSTVDVFINNSLVSQQQVPAGPFSIGNIPIIAGPGMMQVVVRDMLGREQIIQQPFFGSSYLLRQGLNDYSFEAGWLRRNYGLESNDYDTRFGSGTWRRGFTSWFTGEVHAEVSERGNRAFGLGSAFLLGDIGVINASVAASGGERGNGALYGLGFIRQGRVLGASARVQYASAEFWQLGLDPGQASPRILADAALGVSFGRAGSLNLGYIRQDYREADRAPVRLANLGWSVLVGRSAFAGLNITRSFTGDRSTSVGVFLNIPLGDLTNSSTSVQRTTNPDGPRWTGSTSLQKSLPLGEGWGYRVRADDAYNMQAGASYQNNVGTYSFDVATQPGGEAAARVGVQGGFVSMGGYSFASRRSTDSFALVRVPGFEGVRVYNGNLEVARTNKDGVAIVPRLLAYQNNSISIDEQDLPMDARVNVLRLPAVPWFRSGVELEFPVQRVLSAEMTALNEAGVPIEAGASARLSGDSEVFYVAEGGRLYLVGLKPQNRVEIDVGGKRCVVDFPFTPSNDPLPDLGKLTCKEGVR